MLDFPDPPDDLSRFPTRTLAVGTRIHRLHHADLGPCWYGSRGVDDVGGGRFDLPHPDGTSYWALQPEAAFLETIARRPITVIPLEQVDRYRLTTVELPRPIEAANVPVQKARSFGLTDEFHTTTDYRRTRRWAVALRRAGRAALLAIPRHDVTGRLRTLALFGAAGEHVPTGWGKRLDTRPIPSDVVDAMHGWGIRCVPIPFDVDTIDP